MSSLLIMQDPKQAEYIQLLWNRLREQNTKAMAASRRWEERSGQLLDRAHAKGWDVGPDGPDRWQYTEMREKDLELTDAMAAWSWHEREAKRCAAAITAAYHARRLLGLIP